MSSPVHTILSFHILAFERAALHLTHQPIHFLSFVSPAAAASSLSDTPAVFLPVCVSPKMLEIKGAWTHFDSNLKPSVFLHV